MNCLCDGKYVLDLLRKHNVEIHKHCYLGWLSDYFYLKRCKSKLIYLPKCEL